MIAKHHHTTPFKFYPQKNRQQGLPPQEYVVQTSSNEELRLWLLTIQSSMRPQGLCLSELAERSRALGVSGTQDLQILRAQKQAPQADLGGLASIPIRDNSTGDWKSV